MCGIVRSRGGPFAGVGGAVVEQLAGGVPCNAARWAAGPVLGHSGAGGVPSAPRMYDRGGAPELTIRLADSEALHLRSLSGDVGIAAYLQGTLVGLAALRFRKHYGGDAPRLVMAEAMTPWLRAFFHSRWTVAGDREKFTDAWRGWVEGQFHVEGMMHLPPPPSVPPVRPAAPAGAVVKAVPKAAPKPPPPKKRASTYRMATTLTSQWCRGTPGGI